MTPGLLLLVVLPILAAASAAAPEEPNRIVNGGFEDGLAGWTRQGDVNVEPQAPLSGKASLRIGPGKGLVTQRYAVPGLRIIWFGATAQVSSIQVQAEIRVRCLDARDRVVMNLRQPLDIKKGLSPKGDSPGIYFKTQAQTCSIEVGIEKLSAAPGNVIADSAALYDYDRGRQAPVPQCNLTEYMTPIWNDGTVFAESALMLSVHGGPASAKLLYRPTRILRVQDTTLKVDYVEGKDFEVDGDRIVARAGSRMPEVRDSEFPAEQYPWLSLVGKHVFVTYSHEDAWSGPAPISAVASLPHTAEKLLRRRPLAVVAYGDSITLGINVSGYRNDPPYMPTWPDLAADGLRRAYGDGKIRVINTALGGMTSEWGRDNARDAVASLRPDLVLIAFGMNDFWSLTPEQYRDNLVAIMRTIRERNPQAEFVLVSSIRFDPLYTAEAVYVNHMTGYERELKALTGPGVALLDLTALSDFLYGAKDPKDLLADPMHPDDFLARVFAQYLVALLLPPGKRVN